MELKAAITKGAPARLIAAFGTMGFADAFLHDVVGTAFGIEDPLRRPAEYCVLEPDITNEADGLIGVGVRLTGASRDGRTPKVFHDAQKALELLVERTTGEALHGTGKSAQIFIVMVLDKEIEVSPGSGRYSNVLESVPKVVRDPALSD